MSMNVYIHIAIIAIHMAMKILYEFTFIDDNHRKHNLGVCLCVVLYNWPIKMCYRFAYTTFSLISVFCATAMHGFLVQDWMK